MAVIGTVKQVGGKLSTGLKIGGLGGLIIGVSESIAGVGVGSMIGGAIAAAILKDDFLTKYGFAEGVRGFILGTGGN